MDLDHSIKGRGAAGAGSLLVMSDKSRRGRSGSGFAASFEKGTARDFRRRIHHHRLMATTAGADG
jgi:hypothetical protein